MRASGTFAVEDFTPAPVQASEPAIETAVPVGLATMRKRYEGEVSGVSATLFTAAYDQGSGTGELAGIRGAGGMAVDADGTHRIWFEYEVETP